MTKQHTRRARRSAWGKKSAIAESVIEHEMPLLAAIAREMRAPDEDIASLLPGAHKLLQQGFQSIDRPQAIKYSEVA